MAVGVPAVSPVSRMATPRKAVSGRFSAMRMPRTRPPQHHPLAKEIDNAPAPVGRFVGGFETHGQGEGVEPHAAARPGSEPADFHLTPRKLSAPAGLFRPVAPNLPQRHRDTLKIPG